MTGIKVRVLRPGGWADMDIDDLADDEWPAVIGHGRRFGIDPWPLLAELAKWVRDRRAAGEGQAGA